ncbi:hypothetical protein DFH07DRAFT_773984 [Mycena maculata]|uniref:Uncharacterized protein n=1 Tax=Mycena maculata TaxID=230809 RepID=A0AAD7NCG8_9AGAR|nr:hypothetical protein DFH07DRAFT_773984 [Mycena maculata]
MAWKMWPVSVLPMLYAISVNKVAEPVTSIVHGEYTKLTVISGDGDHEGLIRRAKRSPKTHLRSFSHEPLFFSIFWAGDVPTTRLSVSKTKTSSAALKRTEGTSVQVSQSHLVPRLVTVWLNTVNTGGRGLSGGDIRDVGVGGARQWDVDVDDTGRIEMVTLVGNPIV